MSATIVVGSFDLFVRRAAQSLRAWTFYFAARITRSGCLNEHVSNGISESLVREFVDETSNDGFEARPFRIDPVIGVRKRKMNARRGCVSGFVSN